tara:strand:+ start:2421 stop:2789 length:369 start_codon:yes stop_codon:yes gene_type:complete
MEPDLTSSQKKIFIYNKITDRSVNSNILNNYIINNNFKYTQNNNGIFINLYSIDDNYIDDMFKIIVDKINYTNLINHSDFNNQKDIYYDKPIINDETIFSYKEINDEDFDEYDIDLINFSKI